MKISGKYIIEIGTFLENYYMLGYTWKETLTHDVLSQFLHQKGRRSVRLIISNIQKEDILTGECIFVRDEVGQVIPYKNPLRNFTNITNANASELEEIRKKLLNEQGFTYNENGEVVLLEQQPKRKSLFIKGGNNNDKY